MTNARVSKCKSEFLNILTVTGCSKFAHKLCVFHFYVLENINTYIYRHASQDINKNVSFKYLNIKQTLVNQMFLKLGCRYSLRSQIRIQVAPIFK